MRVLKARLVRCEWKPGTMLQEQTLADELGVSKTPVREALVALSMRGLVSPVPRLGYVVADIELNDLIEVFRFRMLLEGDFVQGLAASGRLLTAGAPGGWEEEHAFHRRLAELAGGPRMRRILEDLLDETSRALHFLELAPAIGRQLTEDHAAIAEALQGRDRDLARALLTVHLTRLRESVMASLRQKLRDENVLA